MAKIGELFVDLGVNSGNALNSLTNFSLKFLALKNAAEQLGDVFDGMFGDVARYGQELLKMGSTIGMSEQWLQRMKYRAEQTGTSLETVVSTIKNLQQENAKILMGEGNISPFQKLGIDMSMMREPAQLLDEIMGKVLRLQPAFRQEMLSELGISEDILFMYQQKNIKINDSLLLTDKEVKDLNQMNKEWVSLKQTIEGINNKSVASVSDSVSDGVRNLREFIDGFMEASNKAEYVDNSLENWQKKFKEMAEDGSPFWRLAEGLTGMARAVSGIVKGFSVLIQDILTGLEVVVDFISKLSESIGSLFAALISWENPKDALKEIWKGFGDSIEEANKKLKIPKWLEEMLTETAPKEKPQKVDDVFTQRQGESDLDYFNRTEPLYDYGGNNASVTYNDNSQTTINTSEGTREYERLNNQRIDKTKSEIGTIELLSRRG